MAECNQKAVNILYGTDRQTDFLRGLVEHEYVLPDFQERRWSLIADDGGYP